MTEWFKPGVFDKRYCSITCVCPACKDVDHFLILRPPAGSENNPINFLFTRQPQGVERSSSHP